MHPRVVQIRNSFLLAPLISRRRKSIRMLVLSAPSKMRQRI
jgi:hypothetical protein